jgi:uncharacterized protein YbdZ (MbtH family)
MFSDYHGPISMLVNNEDSFALWMNPSHIGHHVFDESLPNESTGLT